MATYRPDPANGWLAAVRGTVVLLAPSTAASDLVALWPQLGAEDPTPHVLDRLTAAGLAATPPFALVVRHADDESARVVARGGITVRVGDTAISGAGVSTWTERVIDAGASVIVVRTDAEGSDAGAELPIVEGIVPANARELPSRRGGRPGCARRARGAGCGIRAPRRGARRDRRARGRACAGPPAGGRSERRRRRP